MIITSAGSFSEQRLLRTQLNVRTTQAQQWTKRYWRHHTTAYRV